MGRRGSSNLSTEEDNVFEHLKHDNRGTHLCLLTSVLVSLDKEPYFKNCL